MCKEPKISFHVTFRKFILNNLKILGQVGVLGITRTAFCPILESYREVEGMYVGSDFRM